MTVAAIIPAFEEEERVAATVRSLVDTGSIADILVVDDGSSDATAEQAIAAGARVLRVPRNRGKGAAVSAGVNATQAPVLLLCDADLGETASSLIALLKPVLDGEADMAIAAPPRTGGPSGFGAVESFARWGIRRATRFDATRPLSGQRAIARTSLPAGFADGFGLEVALTIDVVRAGGRVVEIPVAFSHARTGRDLAGFAHRAKQGIAVARALAARIGRRA